MIVCVNCPFPFSCWTLTPNSERLLTLDCGRTIGRYVTVSHQDVPLSLSEVEIYSTWNSPANTVPQLPKPHGKEITHITEILVNQSSIEKPKGHHICR